jgi:kynureninase
MGGRFAARRGSRISLRHPEADCINPAVIQAVHALPDFREPDNLRLGPAPLHTAYVEVWETVERIRRVMADQSCRRYAATWPSAA